MKTVFAGALAASFAMPLVAQIPTSHVWSPGSRPTAPAPPARPQARIPYQHAENMRLAVPNAAATASTNLHLTCDGFGTVERSESSQVHGFSALSGGSVSMHSSEQHAAQVLVEIGGNGGRIYIPSEFVPPIHSHSDDGWRPFDSLDVGDTGIHGRFKLNFLNKPKVTIDRMTGHLGISGIGSFSFSGHCETYDPNAAPIPKF